MVDALHPSQPLLPSKLLWLAGALLVCRLAFASAAPVADEDSPGDPHRQRSFDIPRIDQTIKVDGVLDEQAWTAALVFELEFETRPAENQPPDVRTECRMFHSESHLHYGCHAFDPEPEKIRGRLSDRDNAVADDTVGIAIDPFNSKTRSFVLDVSAGGVQNDRLYTEESRRSDPSWDTIWDSAGRIVDDGYVVEAAIPFSSLRFPRTAGKQAWGFSFRRYRPRDVTYRIALHPNDRNNPCRSCQHDLLVGFEGISPGPNLEITPTLTSIQNRTRSDESNQLESDDPDFDPGVTLRWGMTPNLTLSGTLNPDFSQVEADVAQLAINERFALFFPERRPFFLEGTDTFSTPFQVVYSRSVADPSWGLKVTGTEGRNTIGAFVSRDETTNLLLPGVEGSAFTSLDLESDVAVLRYERNVGKESTLGALVTDRSAGSYENQVAGVDGRLRFTDSDTVLFQLLTSSTDYGTTLADRGIAAGEIDDEAINLTYRHEKRNWNLLTDYEDVGEDFRADLGFVPQVGYERYLGRLVRTWYFDGSRFFSTWNAGVQYEQLDRETPVSLRAEGGISDPPDLEALDRPTSDLLREESSLWGGFSGRLQSNFLAGFIRSDEVLSGVSFQLDEVWFDGSFQPTSDLLLAAGMSMGDDVDVVGVRLADSIDLGVRARYNFGNHLRGDLSHNLRRLELTAGRLFEANLSELRLVYQFNLRMFLRGIFQYATIDRQAELYSTPVLASESDLFGQLLFTYKVNPQTAVYLGYSGAYLEMLSQGLEQTGDTIFLKLSYAWLP